jgi:hypothetical protein
MNACHPEPIDGEENLRWNTGFKLVRRTDVDVCVPRLLEGFRSHIPNTREIFLVRSG